MEINEYLDKASSNLTIYDGFVKAETMLSYYDNIGCSISGGADSDIVMDIITKLDKDKKVKYVWFDEWYGAVYGCPICEGIWMMGYHEPELFCPYCGSKLYYKIQ